MPSNNEPDGKNSLLGEFLVSLARAPEPVQESILLFGLKAMMPYAATLIHPYPMLAHMHQILQARANQTGSGGSDPVDH